jgi:uncharacterized protein
MMEQARAALKELQEIDNRIADAEERVREFDPLFAEVEEPALVLETEVNTARNRLQEMKVEERRLELSVDEKRTRSKRLEERLGSVRNLREEAAVTAEHDMVKRSLQNDEQEAYTLIDQMRKVEARLEELGSALAEAKAQVEPRRAALLTERDAVTSELERLNTRRSDFAAGLDPRELKLYEGIRAGGRRRAVAELTHDGACGNCFGIVPLQLQNEIRHGTSLIRCEACGVILAAPTPAESAADEAAVEE